jgi:hypothetical protein
MQLHNAGEIDHDRFPPAFSEFPFEFTSALSAFICDLQPGGGGANAILLGHLEGFRLFLP